MTLDGARSKALKATKAERKAGGVILFGLRTTSCAGGPSSARPAAGPPGSGATTPHDAEASCASARERAYFFYLDRGAHRSYEHPGRVVLVGAASGRVIRSRSLRFAPAIGGRLPVFLRSREGYEARATASRPGRTPSRARSHARA